MNALLYEILVALVLCWIGYTLVRPENVSLLDRIVVELNARRTMLSNLHLARQEESENLMSLSSCAPLV